MTPNDFLWNSLALFWGGLLSILFGLLAYFVRSKSDEIQRLSNLLSRTREEIARDYQTKAEGREDMMQVLARLEALDAKLDRLVERTVPQRNEGGR